MRLAVHDLVGDYAITLEEGGKVHDAIAPVLARGESVELDFSGVRAFAAPFFNAALAPFLEGHTEDELGRRLQVEQLGPAGLNVVRQVIRNARRWYTSPAYRAARDKVLGTAAEER